MTKDDLVDAYRAYIGCLNRRDWSRLAEHVSENAQRNGEALGVAGYRAMLERDVAAIPDLRFTIDLLVADPPVIGARLSFDCTPTGKLFGLPINGRRITFTENVFYRFSGRKVETVWSVIDKDAIAKQLLNG